MILLRRAKEGKRSNAVSDVLVDMAMMYDLQGRYEEALDTYAQCIEIKRTAEVLNNMGEVYMAISANSLL